MFREIFGVLHFSHAKIWAWPERSVEFITGWKGVNTSLSYAVQLSWLVHHETCKPPEQIATDTGRAIINSPVAAIEKSLPADPPFLPS